VKHAKQVYFAASAAELVQRSRLGEAFPFFNATTTEADKDALNHKRAKSVDTGTTAATAAVNAAAAASAISSEQSSPRSYTGSTLHCCHSSTAV
jgi:6,7-dimethyl-8-ribityllumazine synthase